MPGKVYLSILCYFGIDIYFKLIYVFTYSFIHLVVCILVKAINCLSILTTMNYSFHQSNCLKNQFECIHNKNATNLQQNFTKVQPYLISIVLLHMAYAYKMASISYCHVQHQFILFSYMNNSPSHVLEVIQPLEDIKQSMHMFE